MTPRQQKIADVYKQTQSTKKAAKRLKISHQAVQQSLARAKQPRERSPLSYDAYVNENLASIRTMLGDEDMSLAEVARCCGMAPETLRRHLRTRGIETNPKTTYGPKDRATWERMHGKGLSPYDIHKKTGVSRTTIDRHLRRRGLSRDKADATRLALASDPTKRRGKSGEPGRKAS
jgi:transposase